MLDCKHLKVEVLNICKQLVDLTEFSKLPEFTVKVQFQNEFAFDNKTKIITDRSGCKVVFTCNAGFNHTVKDIDEMQKQLDCFVEKVCEIFNKNKYDQIATLLSSKNSVGIKTAIIIQNADKSFH